MILEIGGNVACRGSPSRRRGTPAGGIGFSGGNIFRDLPTGKVPYPYAISLVPQKREDAPANTVEPWTERIWIGVYDAASFVCGCCSVAIGVQDMPGERWVGVCEIDTTWRRAVRAVVQGSALGWRRKGRSTRRHSADRRPIAGSRSRQTTSRRQTISPKHLLVDRRQTGGWLGSRPIDTAQTVVHTDLAGILGPSVERHLVVRQTVDALHDIDLSIIGPLWSKRLRLTIDQSSNPTKAGGEDEPRNWAIHHSPSVSQLHPE